MKTPGEPQSPARKAVHRDTGPDGQPRSRRATFRPEDRLRRRKEFREAQACGRRLYTTHFGLCLAPGARPRLGLVATRRLGKAVRRNRVKRLVREFFRRHQGELPPVDLIIMAKQGAAGLTYAQVSTELARLLLAGGTETHD